MDPDPDPQHWLKIYTHVILSIILCIDWIGGKLNYYYYYYYVPDVEVRQPAADGGGAAGAVHAGGPRPHRLPDTRQVPRLLLCDRHARLLQAQVPEAQRRFLLVQAVRGTHSILLNFFIFYIFYQKFPFIYIQVSIKDVQDTGEAFSPQKRPSNTSKHDLKKNSYFCGSFLLSWIRIRIQ